MILGHCYRIKFSNSVAIISLTLSNHFLKLFLLLLFNNKPGGLFQLIPIFFENLSLAFFEITRTFQTTCCSKCLTFSLFLLPQLIWLSPCIWAPLPQSTLLIGLLCKENRSKHLLLVFSEGFLECSQKIRYWPFLKPPQA